MAHETRPRTTFSACLPFGGVLGEATDRATSADLGRIEIEEPEDADLVLDTSQISPEEAVARVVDLLVEGGWVRPE